MREDAGQAPSLARRRARHATARNVEGCHGAMACNLTRPREERPGPTGQEHHGPVASRVPAGDARNASPSGNAFRRPEGQASLHAMSLKMRVSDGYANPVLVRTS
jgi:hypothetical protein